MGFKKFLSESQDVFPDVDVIKFDPDRVDSYDLVNGVMPTLVKMAYVNLLLKKKKYEKTYDSEEDDPFEFTKDALEDELTDVIDHFVDRLNDLTGRDKLHHIDQISKEFKEPLK